jgi:hypothetical protein
MLMIDPSGHLVEVRAQFNDEHLAARKAEGWREATEADIAAAKEAAEAAVDITEAPEAP